MSSVFDVPCRVEAVTPLDASQFFGYYDICPWDPSDKELALLRFTQTADHHPDGSERADICVWHPGTGRMRKIAETRAWNFHHGSRLRWLKNGSLLFNDLDGTSDCTRVVAADGGALRHYAKGVAALSDDEKTGIAPAYARLGRYSQPYGYRGATHVSIAEPHPKDDGLWSVDMETGRTTLLFSLDLLAGRGNAPEHARQFVTHPQFNPSGSRFVFAHIYATADGATFNNTFVSDADGQNLRLVLSEKCGHLDWLDDETILVWTRSSAALRFVRRRDLAALRLLQPAISALRRWHSPLRNALLSEGLYIVRVDDPKNRSLIPSETIRLDGHNCIHPSRRLMVGDTYADRDNYLHLFLYDLATHTRVNIARFLHGVPFQERGLRCDLHPRWNRAGDKIAVDICENGIRRLAVVDAAPAMREMGFGAPVAAETIPPAPDGSRAAAG